MGDISSILWYNAYMKKTIAFFGHRHILDTKIRERIKNEIEINLCDDIQCLIGVHGEFDRLALSVCRELRESYPQIKIIVVLTSLNIFKKSTSNASSIMEIYRDVETMIYDIEDEHFKKHIVVSNRKMVDDCDLVICYVDMKKSKSGAKRAINYAKKKGKKIINLFRDEDRAFYGMSEQEIEAEWNKFIKKKN